MPEQIGGGMERALKVAAFLASLAAFAVIVGFGSFLAAIRQSGAQGLGSMLAFGGIIAFAAAMLLVFAPGRTFAAPGGGIVAAAAAVLAVLPVGAVAAAVLLFARPLGSPAPLLDFGLVALGLLLAAGALSIVGLGLARARRRGDALPPSLQLSAAEASRRNPSDWETPLRGTLDPADDARDRAAFDHDDDIRVTRV